MVPDRQKVRTDGQTEWTDGRTDAAKTISLRLRRGITIEERGSKIARNSVFDCQLLPVRRQMTIEISVSNNFLSTFIYSINGFNCHLSIVS